MPLECGCFLHHYKSGLKLISLIYVEVVRQIRTIQLDYCKQLSSCIKTLINQNIHYQLYSRLQLIDFNK